MDQIDEAELIRAGQSGGVLIGSIDGARRAVQADLLRKCCHELNDQIDPRGLKVKDAVVVGCLDLTGLSVPFPLSFDECEFDSAPVVEGAQLFGLSLVSCPRLPGLLGNGLRLRRDLDLSGSLVVGAHSTNASMSGRSAIWLCEADIGGQLLCIDTTIDGQGHRAIQADQIHTGGTIQLIRKFTALGGIRLLGARIDGSLDLSGARIESSGEAAIDLGDAAIKSSIFLIDDGVGRRPVIRGRIDLSSAHISGRLLIRNATIDVSEEMPEEDTSPSSIAAGAVINAPGLSVASEVMLEGHCEVTGRIHMPMSDLSSVSIGSECALRAPGRTALDLTNSQIRALLRLDRNASVEGSMRLAGAVVHGTLALHGEMSKPVRWSLVGGRAMTVHGEVFLEGLRTEGGRVSFRGATLGSLSAGGSRLKNPGGYSIDLTKAVVNGSVQLDDGFTSVGLVGLNRSSLAGRLQLTGGSFSCPAPTPHNEMGHAIEAVSMTARGGIDLGWKAISPSVDFTDATTTFLADDPVAWPEHFIIGGLTYDRFEKPYGAQPKPIWDHAARCSWLSRQTEFDSGSYEQAARVFKQHGYISGSERILIAQRRHARQIDRGSVTLLRRTTDAIYAIVGYGYRPSRVLWLLAVLLLLVIASLEVPVDQATLRTTNGNGNVYTTSGLLASSANPAASDPSTRSSLQQADSCGDGEVRCFSPVLYAIDSVIPLISLDQRSTWYPDPQVHGGELMLWWLNFATLLGWLLSSIFVLSLARLSRSA